MYMFNNKGIRYNVNGEYFMSLSEVSGYTGCSVNSINKALGNTSSCNINGYHIIRETNNYRLAKSNRYEYVSLFGELEVSPLLITLLSLISIIILFTIL